MLLCLNLIFKFYNVKNLISGLWHTSADDILSDPLLKNSLIVGFESFEIQDMIFEVSFY